MSQPSQLTPTDQDALVKQIGIGLMRAAPQEWQQVRTEYRAAGRYYELTAEITDEDGEVHAWTASHDVAMLFAKLRAGMHSEEGGTWFNARYQIDRPSRYNLEFDRAEPQWRTPPPLQAYRDELRFFPRAEDDVPEWLMHRMSGLRPEQPGRRFRVARIFDGRGPSGRPSVNRPPVDDEDQATLLNYLDRAPLVLPERGFDVDRLSADGGKTVPVAFHSDGTWIWPAAVNFYLRHYGLPPESGLVEHARANDFVAPEIDEATASEAAATITGPRPSGPPRPDGARPQPGDERPADRPPMAEQPPSPPAGMPAIRPEPDASPAGGIGAAFGNRFSPDTSTEEPPVPSFGSSGPPAAPSPEPRPQHSSAPPEVVLDRLRHRLDGLGVPESAYRIGQPTPDAWYLEAVDDGWQVGWYDDDLSAPMLFDEAEDAAAFLLGKLMLADEERPSGGRHSGLADLGDMDRPEDDRRDEFRRSELDRPVLDRDDEDRPDRGDSPRPFGSRRPAEPANDFRPASFEASREGSDPALTATSLGSPLLPADEPAPSYGGSALDSSRFDPPSFDTFAPSFDDDRGQDRDPLAARTDGGVNGRDPDELPAERTATHAVAPDEQDERVPMFEPRNRSGRFDDIELRMPPIEQDDDRPDPRDRPSFTRHGQDDLAEDDVPAGFGGFSSSFDSDLGIRDRASDNGHGLDGGSGLPVRPDRSAPVATRESQPDVPPAREAAGMSRPADEAAGAASQWPIQPLSGEPPLTLFRHKQLMHLPAGTEIDRFGGEEGNLTYDSGTPFEQRSLVPDWVNRPYHVYQLQKPIEVLVGVAIPWFDQPGGGTAYLLPDAIAEHVDRGELVQVEVESDEHP